MNDTSYRYVHVYATGPTSIPEHVRATNADPLTRTLIHTPYWVHELRILGTIGGDCCLGYCKCRSTSIIINPYWEQPVLYRYVYLFPQNIHH